MSGPIAYYEIRWRPDDSDGEWSIMTVSPDSSTVAIKGVDRSKVYVIQARSVGPSGLKSVWVDISHTVASNNYCQTPENMDADGMADGVRIMWTFPKPLHADIDVCIERGTSAGGPFIEVAKVRSDYVVIQELVEGTYYYRARTQNFREEYSSYSSVVSGSPLTTAELQASVADALAAAEAAQDTADGKIDSFFQTSPPSSANLGDIWFDTDDNNKIYRYNGSSWVVSQDTGIPLAIANAAGAQATADSKVRTFYTSSTPTATGLGDLWYNTSSKAVLRWDGVAWAKISEVASAVVNDFIMNGNFAQGFEYWTIGSQWTTATTSGFLSQNHAIATGSGATPDSRITCDRVFSVLPGEAYVLSTMCLKTNTPNGDFKIGLVFLDIAGAQVSIVESSLPATTIWTRQKVVITVPSSGVAAARVTIGRFGHSVGEYHAYDVKVSRLAADASELLIGIGKNLIPNSEFGGRSGSYSPWANTWNPAGGTFTIKNRKSGIDGGAAYTIDGDYGQLSIYRGARGTGIPAVFDLSNNANPTIPVEPGSRYEVHSRIAAQRCNVSLVVGWFDSTGAYISETGTAYYGPGGSAAGTGGKSINDYTQIGSFVTAPSNARTARVWFRRSDTNVGEADSYLWILQPYFGRAGVNQSHFSLYNPGPNLDADGIGNGAQAGVVSISDLHDDGGWASRLGLRIGNSGQRLGNQRNNVRSSTSAYGMTRDTTALSATSSGAVSVNAHTCKYGGYSVLYNAVSNAVTGLTQSVTYVIYCLDADLSGGTKTYYAGTNPDAVMGISDDVYVVGQITIPTSGSSSGGSGSSGSGPGSWCVCVESFLPDGTRAGDVQTNFTMPCYNNRATEPNIFHWPVQANHIGESECLRMVTESGATLIASVTTPMTLENDQCVFLPDMLHRRALVYRLDGSFRWEYVTELTSVGVKPVAKIQVHNQCYFSGETMNAFIATHNQGAAKP